MYLDIFIFFIILIAIITGLRNGIITEIISVFGFVINIFFAKIYTPIILNFFSKDTKLFGNNYLLTYIVVFISVYFIISMVLVFVKKALKNQNKGFFNKFIGGILGFFKGIIAAIIIVVIYSYIIDFVPSLEKYSYNSKSMEIFYELIPNFESYIPDILLDKFNENATKKIIEKSINTIL